MPNGTVWPGDQGPDSDESAGQARSEFGWRHAQRGREPVGDHGARCKNRGGYVMIGAGPSERVEKVMESPGRFEFGTIATGGAKRLIAKVQAEEETLRLAGIGEANT